MRWSLGMILTAWDLFYRHDATEGDIQRETHTDR